MTSDLAALQPGRPLPLVSDWWTSCDAELLGLTHDGVLVAARPLVPADRAWFGEWLAALSAESRYLRFLETFTTPPPSLLHALVDTVDGRDHVALVGLVRAPLELSLPSWPDAELTPVAEGRFVRHDDARTRAEIAYTVMDEWQGRGVGSLLLRRLIALALPLGITTFTGSLAANNLRSYRLIRKAGPVVRRSLERGVADVTVDIDPAYRA